MKILAMADLHGAQYRLNILLGNIEKYLPDLVIICGDITQFGPADVAKNFLNQIPVTTFAIIGNIDTAEVSKAIDESKATNIEMKRVEKNGIPFIGINGLDPFEIKNLIESKKIKELIDENSVIVSHVPPYGFQDRVFLGMHAGDKDLREIVDNYKPRLVICGHIHEDPGYEKKEKTIVVNCSMGKRGEGALIDINEKVTIRMLD